MISSDKPLHHNYQNREYHNYFDRLSNTKNQKASPKYHHQKQQQINYLTSTVKEYYQLQFLTIEMS
jgi:hypothetical protein